MQLKERVFFTRYFAILLHAGLTITQSLGILKDQLITPAWQKILDLLTSAVQNGHTLSESLEQFPKDFPPFFSKMVAVGEKSGNLPQVFSYLQHQVYKDWLLVSKVKRAFIYPVVILSILFIVSIGLVVFIVPRVEKLFVQLKIPLPLPTRILLQIQHAVTSYGLLMLFGVVAFVFLVHFLLKINSIRFLTHKVALNVPLIGKIIRNLNCARFMQILSTLMAGGVTLVDSLHIAATTVSNMVFQNEISEAAAFAQSGRSLSDALIRAPKVFPSLMTHMLSIGEKTGNLQEQAKELSIFYAQEVDNSVKTLSTMIEPLLLVVVAGGVGSVAMAIVLPLYQLPALLNK